MHKYNSNIQVLKGLRHVFISVWFFVILYIKFFYKNHHHKELKVLFKHVMLQKKSKIELVNRLKAQSKYMAMQLVARCVYYDIPYQHV